MTKAVIFDIDGTLADLSHRLHHIKRQPINWDAFFAECGNDTPILPIHELAHLIVAQGYKLILVSGRSDKVREQTEAWLATHGVPHQELHMRKEGDYRQDTIVKSEILDNLLSAGNEIAFVVDDRPSVVAMWRSRGLTCLQCREWQEDAPSGNTGLLTLMVGPSGAGKSHWLQGDGPHEMGIHPSHVISSDQIRADLCGNFRDQTKNDEVFAALHAVVKTRLSHGLSCVVDATNLRRKDRLAAAGLANGGKVRYIVIDRPTPEKRRHAGWRAELPFDLIAKHEQMFNSQLTDILNGDRQENTVVIDLRKSA